MAAGYYIEYITSAAGVKKLKRRLDSPKSFADIFNVSVFTDQVLKQKGIFLKIINYPSARLRLVCWSYVSKEGPYSGRINRHLAFKRVDD